LKLADYVSSKEKQKEDAVSVFSYTNRG